MTRKTITLMLKGDGTSAAVLSATETALLGVPGFAAIAAFFLFSEHRAHVFGLLPFPLLLACPLLHVFARVTSDNTPAYGLWALATIKSAIFIILALSFTRPATTRDWRSFSAFSAFIVALFAEMYGY